MKMLGDPSRTLLLITFYLVCHSTGIKAQQTAGQRFEKALYLEEVNGKLQQAIDQYQLILKEFPANREIIAKSQLHIGICYEKLGLNQARENYQAVINKYPDQKGEVAIANERLKRLEWYASESSMKAEQTFKLATDLFKQFIYESAAAEYEKVIRLAPKSRLAEEAQLWIGHCYYKLGKYDQALTTFKALIKEFPESTIVPVTELMISQVNQSMAQEPKKSNVITLDDKTILDPTTGIRYTKIKTWAGKYDVIKSAASITGISPNRKFLVSDNLIIPFDNREAFNLKDSTLSFMTISVLSQDATRIALMTENALSIIAVSPETGHLAGPKIELSHGNFFSPRSTTNWSPDGNNIAYSLSVGPYQSNVWTHSTRDSSKAQVTNLAGIASNPVFTKDGLSILYKCIPQGGDKYSIRMNQPLNGTTTTIADSCWYNDRFILSPDNRWIAYKEQSDKPVLLNLADKQKRALSPPEEAGEFVSWADGGRKMYFYHSSYEAQNLIKVTSVSGGPVFQCGKQFGQYPVDWLPDNKGLLILEKGEDGNVFKEYQNYLKNPRCIRIISLTSDESRVIDGIEDPGSYPSFSPDGSRILLGLDYPGKPTDLSIIDFSLNEKKIKGKPRVIFKDFDGWAQDCSWSPDSKKIALCHGGEVWICSPDGDNPIQLTKTVSRENFPKWSPDGTLIAVFNPSTHQTLIISATDGAVIRTFDQVSQYDWIPGGTDIILACPDGKLLVASTSTGKIRTIIEWDKICSDFAYLKCSPDGKLLAFIGFGNHKNTVDKSIFLINIVDGKVTEVATENIGNKDQFRWSPDSKWLAYCMWLTPYSNDLQKTHLEGALWEADLTDFMKKMER